MERIRCAIVGTGRIGSSLEDDRKREKPASHAGAINHNSQTVLCAGADTDRHNLEAFGKRWKLSPERLFVSLEKMLDAEKPDILHIASNTEVHIAHLLAALRRNISVIVLEKPVAENISQSRSVKKALAASRSRVIVNHERRFAADYCHVREVIRSGIYEDLLCIYARLFMGRKTPVHKVLWHDGTHMVDLIRFLLGGDFSAIETVGDPFSARQNVLLVGKKGKCSIVLDCSPGRDHLHFELDLSFSAGRIRVGNGIYAEEKSGPSPLYEVYRSLVPVKLKFRKTGYFSNMMAHAVDLFRNPAKPSASTFADGLKALSLIQKFLDIA
ncbi:MAG: Gfo/Idh/MocA family oxidoreductase [Spirochaetales bacterium]|nr:Gfo/Idh/MocA family oxidoreductase [Spirochaetales bacterium]